MFIYSEIINKNIRSLRQSHINKRGHSNCIPRIYHVFIQTCISGFNPLNLIKLWYLARENILTSGSFKSFLRVYFFFRVLQNIFLFAYLLARGNEKMFKVRERGFFSRSSMWKMITVKKYESCNTFLQLHWSWNLFCFTVTFHT